MFCFQIVDANIAENEFVVKYGIFNFTDFCYDFRQ